MAFRSHSWRKAFKSRSLWLFPLWYPLFIDILSPRFLELAKRQVNFLSDTSSSMFGWLGQAHLISFGCCRRPVPSSYCMLRYSTQSAAKSGPGGDEDSFVRLMMVVVTQLLLLYQSIIASLLLLLPLLLLPRSLSAGTCPDVCLSVCLPTSHSFKEVQIKMTRNERTFGRHCLHVRARMDGWIQKRKSWDRKKVWTGIIAWGGERRRTRNNLSVCLSVCQSREESSFA